MLRLNNRSAVCCLSNCFKKTDGSHRHCYTHRRQHSVARFLNSTHFWMLSRTRGKMTKRPDLYLNKKILPSKKFYTWSRNNSQFWQLYKNWVMSNFDRKLTPSVNRIDSSKGYVIGNIEWMTNSQNCGLSASVRKLKSKRVVYSVLGVKSNAR